MKNLTIVVLIIIGFILLTVGFWGFRYYTASIRGQIDARETIQSGDYRVFSYDHFFDLYSNVQAFEDQIRNQQEALETITNEEEAVRYRRNINALKNQRASVVRQYNADARREETVGQFRDDSLPYQIDIEFE